MNSIGYLTIQLPSKPIFAPLGRIATLIPILYSPIQPRRNNLTTLLRMPLHTRNGRSRTCIHLMPHLTSLPIPETDITTTITRGHELAIRTTRHVDSVSGVVVAFEDLFAVLPELVVGAVDEDVVV